VGDPQNERPRSEAGAEEAFQLLVRASATLDEPCDLKTALQALARLTVPLLADTCMVELKGENGSIESAAYSAAAAEYEPVLAELQRHPIDPDGPHPVARAMRAGQTEIASDISDSFRRNVATNERQLQALQSWPARSVVVAPIKLHGKVLGTLALASFEPQRTWGSQELAVIEEIAHRAAARIENARLSDERARLARTLRESLLPPRLPDLAGAEVAARFHPGAATNEVSGDFYDVFAVDAFDWVIAIGDVSGRGVEAAATTALARHTIRAAAIHGATPAAALAVLNDALLAQPPELRLCSAVVGLLAIGSAGARLTIASGGHPAPLHLHADGMVEPIDGSGTLLGVVDEPPLGEADVNLAIGDSVVFYTDGLTEVHRNGRGVEDLVSVVEGCVDLDAAVTAASIDQALLGSEQGDLRDDAVLLVLRILEDEDAPSREEEARSSERERRFRGRRLAWSRWAGRGGGSDQLPSSRAERSGPR
jgi:serine phosphatase RsbU (regulator of sigma subunit)